jgi:exo-beta-1,3-glucanase (GH17 family)
MTRWTFPLAGCILAAILNLAYWAYEGWPVPVPDAGAASVASVSFSPYRRSENPLERVSPTPDEISADLVDLAGRVDSVRTYTSLEGLDAVPRFARPLGIKVVQSAWLGRDPDVNEREIRSLIELANRYPDVIRRVIVGNEVLLRRDLTREQLAGYIRRVKAAIKQPVSYADVWEFWLKNPQLAPEVDYITIHILPYWEDQPIPIDHAIEHVKAIYAKVAAVFPGKKILIGEVGWPSAGRMREGAKPSLVNQARFVRGMARLGRSEGLDYNIVEAFDQPWKRALEGTVGGHWGLLDAEREAKFALSGPVSDDPDWPWHLGLSTAFAALATLLAAGLRPHARCLGWLAFAAAAQLLGTCLVIDGALTSTIAWTSFGWLSGGLGLVASLLLSILLLRALAERLVGTAWPQAPLPSAAEAINLLRGRPRRGPGLAERMLGLVQFGFVVGAAVASVALVVDPRYRDFPSEAFLVPAFGYLGLYLASDQRAAREGALREEALLVALLVLGAVAVILVEGLQGLPSVDFAGLGVAFRHGLRNTQAVGWSVTLLLLALPWSLRLATRRRAAALPASP